MACRLFGAKPLSKPVLGYCRQEQLQWNLNRNTKPFFFKKIQLKMSSAKMASILSLPQCVKLWWLIHASVNWVIISCGNSMLIVRSHTITWTNINLLRIKASVANFSETLNRKRVFKDMPMEILPANSRTFCPRPILTNVDYLPERTFFETWVNIILFSFKKLHLELLFATDRDV